jgi:hypothetical protein
LHRFSVIDFNRYICMNNAISMSAEFEKQKNARALAWTAGVGGSIFFLIWMISWTIPPKIVPVQEEYIEINLGNSEVGSGTDQPELPGEPAPAQQVAYTPPQPAPSHEENVRDVADENETSPDAPIVSKPAVSKPDATKINESKSVTANPAPVREPVAPAPPRPKATMGRTMGGTGNGGNGADTYRPGNGEGSGNGPGDQGVVGGNPNGTRYSGTPRNLGVRVVAIPAAYFEDDFNESGKITLDIEVDGSGKLVSAGYQVSGSTLPRSSKQYTIALRRAREIPYPKMEGGFKQRLTMNFDVK